MVALIVPPSLAAVWRRHRAWRGRARALGAAIAAIAVAGGIPGARLRRAPDATIAAAPAHALRHRDGTLDVTVREAGGGTPLAAARVRALAIDDGRATVAASASADAEGHAHLGPLPRGELWVLADAPGHARGSTHLVVETGARAVAIELGPEHVIDVEVRDDLGAPLPGATLEATSDADPLPVGRTTGADGKAHVDRLAPGPWRVSARAPGFEESLGHASREGEVVSFVLRRLGAITAHVFGPDGKPAAHARVAIAGATLWPARAADTNDSGTVRIGSLAAGMYALRATHDASVSPIELGVALARGEDKSVDLRLGPGRFVTVRATDGDGDDADPVPGARVTLAEGGLSPFPLEATTDKNGRAHLGPIAPGAATLSARAEGFVPRGAVAVGDPPPPESRVVLVRAATLEGRVVDARGGPIDGATIEIAGTDLAGGPLFQDPRRASFQAAHFDAMLAGPSMLLPAGELGVVPGPVPPIPFAGRAFAPAGAPLGSMAAGEGEPWVSAYDGTFSASPISPGRVRAIVHHPDYVEAESAYVSIAPGSTGHVEVVLHEGGALEGRVFDAHDRPVAGARVVASAVRGTLERTTRSASDGTFAFAALPDSIVLSASNADDDTGEVRMPVTIPEGGRQEVTLRLPEPRDPLPVTVTDDRGQPISTAQITATSLAADSPLRATVFTDANGEASLRGSRGLPLRIEVRAPSRAPRVVTVDGSGDSLRIELAPAESATGLVRSARGRDPIGNAQVTLYTELGVRRARTGPDGAFQIAGLAPGTARMRVTAPGFAPIDQPIAVPDLGGRRPFEIDPVELAAEGFVEGVVVDAAGAGVPGARVARDRVSTWLAVGAAPEGEVVTDASGRFHLGGLPEGTVTVEAYAPDLGRARADVTVQSGRVTDDVRLALGAKDTSAPDVPTAGSVAVTLGETGAPVEVVIVSVAEGSEAERAGLAPGDVIASVDGASVTSMADARARLSGPLAADVLVGIRRGGQALALRVDREPIRR